MVIVSVERARRDRRVALAVVAGAVFVASALALLAYAYLAQMDRLPAAASKVDALEVGMSQAAVRGVLGAPDSISPDGREWCYAEPRSWAGLYVYFDADLRLEKHIVDR